MLTPDCWNALKARGVGQRESQVVEWVIKGLSNKEVAEQLFITEKTVKFHLTNIYKKLGVKSRSQLIVWSAPLLKFEEPPSVTLV